MRSTEPAIRSRRVKDVISVTCDGAQVFDFPSVSINRCTWRQKFPFVGLKNSEKSLLEGTPYIYRASAAPWDFQPQGSSLCRTTSWRSLELHKHHSALGLAATPLGNPVADIANEPSGPAGHASPSARCAPRGPLLRGQVPGAVALRGEGESVARSAAGSCGTRA